MVSLGDSVSFNNFKRRTKMRKRFLAVLVTALLIFGTVGVTGATIIVGPQSATTDAGNDASLYGTYSQSGLSEAYTSGVTDFDVFTTTTTHLSNSYYDDYISSIAEGSVTFDLGQTFLIEKLAFWNWGGGSSNDVYSVVSFSLYGDGNWIGDYSPGSGGGLADIYSFGPIQARYFKLDALVSTSNHFNIGEVAFGASAAPVPEPATMLLFGLGLLGLAGVNRRKK